MKRKDKRAVYEATNSELCPLFPSLPSETEAPERRYARVRNPIWSEHKAKFIQHYLKFFVQITKHGAYIDGFAGPQNEGQPDAWTAELVLRSEPKWLRHFFLCEKSRTGVKALRALKEQQPIPLDTKGRRLFRNVEIWSGDFNQNVNKILDSGKISQREATFCLLDQRMFECHWQTLKSLASFKKTPNNKIELLYFLGVGWLHRSISGIRHTDKMLKWWGRGDWKELRSQKHFEIAEIVRKRFKQELHYHFSAAYPIFDRKNGNKVMYYMIHASDHEEAPMLMVRAHQKAVRSLPKEVQQAFQFVKS
jgi:three-Cys-motif partner protein